MSTPDYKALYEQERAKVRQLEARLSENTQAFENAKKQVAAFGQHIRARFGCSLCYAIDHRAKDCPSK